MTNTTERGRRRATVAGTQPNRGPLRDTKEQLILAAEHLFARQGIEGTHIRDINRLSGQRNPSAVHYHFGSKEGLLEAILVRHQQAVEVEVARRLDELLGRFRLSGEGEGSGGSVASMPGKGHPGSMRRAA